MSTGSMTKAELVEEVSRVSDLTKKHSEVIVETVFQSIIDALHRGEKIELRGFGSFRLRQREPRKGRNPKTGDKVDVPPKKVPYFKPGKELKDLLNRDADGAGRAPARTRGRRRPAAGRAAARRGVLSAQRVSSLRATLWSPWRLAYVTGGTVGDAAACSARADGTEDDPLVVHRGAAAFVILNLYPYNNGHLMVVPRRHVASLAEADCRRAGRAVHADARRRERADRRLRAAGPQRRREPRHAPPAPASPIICTSISCRAGTATPTS